MVFLCRAHVQNAAVSPQNAAGLLERVCLTDACNICEEPGSQYELI